MKRLSLRDINWQLHFTFSIKIVNEEGKKAQHADIHKWQLSYSIDCAAAKTALI